MTLIGKRCKGIGTVHTNFTDYISVDNLKPVTDNQVKKYISPLPPNERRHRQKRNIKPVPSYSVQKEPLTKFHSTMYKADDSDI
jgi:hypothetical protein